MSVSDSPVTELERRLLIAEARKYLGSPTDPSDGVGHGGLSSGDPGQGGSEGDGHGGVGRDGGGSYQRTDVSSGRALAERILAILGER
jgi:hypothetical protein